MSAVPQLITSEGTRDKISTVQQLPKFVQWRLYLAWGHTREAFSSEVAHMKMVPTDLQERHLRGYCGRMYVSSAEHCDCECIRTRDPPVCTTIHHPTLHRLLAVVGVRRRPCAALADAQGLHGTAEYEWSP